MFVPAEMSEVDIFVFENDVEPVAQVVAGLGVMHLLDANALGEWAEGISNEWAGRIAAYANQERRALELMKQLDIEDVPMACEGQLRPAEDITGIEKVLQQIESDTAVLRENHARLTRELEHWDLVTRSMEVLAPLSVSISDLRQLEHLHMVAGTIPAENLARLEASLFRIPFSIIPVHYYKRETSSAFSLPTWFRPSPYYRRGVLVFAFCSEEHAPILDRALESAFLDPLALPTEFGGTAQEVLQRVNERRQQAQHELEEIENQRRAMAEKLRSVLQGELTRIRGDRAIAEAMAHFGHRGRVYLIAGWVPKDRVNQLQQAVEEAAAGRVTFEENTPSAPGERFKVPTLLRNSRWLRPLEGLVTTYGIPGYREIDPTPLLGITFVLMFGIMFGDLGHGLVLATIGLLLALRAIPKLGANTASTGQILAACGISSSIFGLLYGSMFGFDNIIPHLWLRPMEDIWSLLEASIAVGVVILNAGFVARLLTAVRGGDFRDAVFDKNGVVGLLLYWSLGAIILLMLLGKPVWGWLVPVVCLLILALFFSSPLTNLIKGIRPLIHGSVAELGVESFFELFEALISYISNTLSYVRLGAFAVAHAGLSMVVFLLADMVGSGQAGGLLRWIVILIGNIVVIGFEGLIVAIQTLRLEYYELFGKFFKGEGVPFKPLTLPATNCQNTVALERSSSR